MAINGKVTVIISTCAVFASALGNVAAIAARADDLATAVYNGVNELRGPCGLVGDDPRLTEAAQRHASDLAATGVGKGHLGSDGSSPQARIADARHTATRYTGEIIYWGTGSLATPGAALDWWMRSPPHRAAILNCAFTAAGFAVAWNGNKMIVVGDFASP